MSAGLAGKALVRAVGTAAAAAAATSEVAAESRAATEQLQVWDGSSSWHLLEESDINEAAALVNVAAGKEVANKALGLAKRMARKPEVQKLFADELGTQVPSIEDQSSEAAMLQIIETLRLENDSLHASNAAARAALDERARLQDQLDVQRDILQDDVLAGDDEGQLVTPPEEEEEEPEVVVAGDVVPDTSGDAALAASIAAEDKKRFDALCSQELADELLAKHIVADDDDDLKKQEKEEPVDEENDASFVEVALALAGIILVVALTRKITPTSAKKALALAGVAAAAVYAKFRAD